MSFCKSVDSLADSYVLNCPTSDHQDIALVSAHSQHTRRTADSWQDLERIFHFRRTPEESEFAERRRALTDSWHFLADRSWSRGCWNEVHLDNIAALEGRLDIPSIRCSLLDCCENVYLDWDMPVRNLPSFLVHLLMEWFELHTEPDKLRHIAVNLHRTGIPNRNVWWCYGQIGIQSTIDSCVDRQFLLCYAGHCKHSVWRDWFPCVIRTRQIDLVDIGVTINQKVECLDKSDRIAVDYGTRNIFDSREDLKILFHLVDQRTSNGQLWELSSSRSDNFDKIHLRLLTTKCRHSSE